MAQRAVTFNANSNHTTVPRLSGWSIRESAAIAGPAVVNLRHASGTGQILEVIELAASQSLTVSYGQGAWKESSGGTYVEVVSGTVQGVIFTEV